MFIHAGAGLHGHEFSRSSTDSDQAPTRPIPLLRSALRPLSDANNRPNRYPRPSLSPDSTLSAAGRRSYSAPVTSRQLPLRPASEVIPRKDLAVRFQEPDMAANFPASQRVLSEDEESVAESELSGSSNSSVRKQRRRRAPRTTTKYSLAHPAPQLKTKQRILIQFRPKNLLQLQRIDDRRATPAFDVLPSSTISGPFALPRLAKRCPRIFKTKPLLGPDDVLIARSEDYNSTISTSTSAESGLDARDLLGVVSPLLDQGDDAAEMVMADGSVWSCKAVPNGSFEFSRVAECGLQTVARWVRKPVRTAASLYGSVVSPTTSPVHQDETWTFSIIDPSTRRHPIMGMLTPRELAIYDTYSTLSTASGKAPPTKPYPPNVTSLAQPAARPSDYKQIRSTEVVPEELKELMIVTACWVGLRLEGWPASLHPKARRRSTALPRSDSISSVALRRRTYPSSSTFASVLEKPSRIPSPTNCEYGISLEATTLTSPVDVPERAMSTGAAYMRRRRSGHQPHFRSRANSLPGPPAEDTGVIKDAYPVNEGAEDEETSTCRIRVRQLTQRLFRRKSCQVR